MNEHTLFDAFSPNPPVDIDPGSLERFELWIDEALNDLVDENADMETPDGNWGYFGR